MQRAVGEPLALGELAGDGDHRRQAGSAGEAQDVARDVLAQVGHAVGAVDPDGVPDGKGVEELRRRGAARRALDLEVPLGPVVGDVAHGIGARADHARHVQQRVLAGQERRRISEAEAELADVVREVLGLEQPRLGADGLVAALVVIAQDGLDAAVAERPRLAAEIAACAAGAAPSSLGRRRGRGRPPLRAARSGTCRRSRHCIHRRKPIPCRRAARRTVSSEQSNAMSAFVSVI